MGKAYSIDLRDRVHAHIESGHSRRDASRRFGVSPSFAVKLEHRVLRTGSTSPACQGRPRGQGKLAALMGILISWVEGEPDITMPELAAKLKAAKGMSAHPASLSRALLAAGYSFKKNTAGVRMRTRGRSPRA
jgi:transposase